MTVLMNEEKGMDTPVKTYLEMYEDHIRGYKAYKMDKATGAALAEINAVETDISISADYLAQ